MERKYLQIAIIINVLFLAVALNVIQVNSIDLPDDVTISLSPTPPAIAQKMPCMMPTPKPLKSRNLPSIERSSIAIEQQEISSKKNVEAIAKMMDEDCDGISNYDDNCLGFPSKNLKDSDGDGFGDACDKISSDISVKMIVTPNRVQVGERITYTITITNHGPTEEAGIIEVIDEFPPALQLNSITPTDGECSEMDGGMICNVQTLAVGRSMKIVVSATAIKSARLVNMVKIENGIGDLNLTNNKFRTVNYSVKKKTLVK